MKLADLGRTATSPPWNGPAWTAFSSGEMVSGTTPSRSISACRSASSAASTPPAICGDGPAWWTSWPKSIVGSIRSGNPRCPTTRGRSTGITPGISSKAPDPSADRPGRCRHERETVRRIRVRGRLACGGGLGQIVVCHDVIRQPRSASSSTPARRSRTGSMAGSACSARSQGNAGSRGWAGKEGRAGHP